MILEVNFIHKPTVKNKDFLIEKKLGYLIHSQTNKGLK